MLKETLMSRSYLNLFPSCFRAVAFTTLFLFFLAIHFSIASEVTNLGLVRSHDPTLMSIYIIPDSTTLRGREASQRFVVMGKYSDGLERDVTLEGDFSVIDSALADVDSEGKVSGVSDGETQLKVNVEGLDVIASIRVEDALKENPISFERSISPILTKQGCNGSNCHGGVKGRGGFKLSLNSLNPREDYTWIARGGVYHVLKMHTGEAEIPRVNIAEPEQSLLLEKPTMQVAHEGGRRIEKNSEDYRTILEWIQKGAPYEPEDGSDSDPIESVSVSPAEIVLDEEGLQQLVVTAKLSSGRFRDISDEVRYESQNEDIAIVDETGLIMTSGTGETNILVRAAGHTVHTRVGVISEPVLNYPDIPRTNFIDDHIFAKLRRFQLVPSGLSDDTEFLRRVCLDIIGMLPPPNRVQEFLNDPDPNKRNKLIDILLDSPEYVDFWTFRFSDFLRASRPPIPNQLYFEWIRGSIAANKPYDQMAQERLAAQGRDKPSRHYHEYNSQPGRILSEEMRVFAGRRFDCAECHDHPFESWSQDQFWGLAAFFGNIDFIGPFEVIFDNPLGGYGDKGQSGLLKHPRRKTVVEPAFLDGTLLAKEHRLDPRLELARYVTSHPYFAESMANRMWGYFLGKGIVDPVDDFKDSNPPTHPELLKALASEFRKSGHNLKQLIRTIVQSRTYQLASQPNSNNRYDQINYSHFIPKPLEAEVLLDAISQVTGIPEVFHEGPESEKGQPPLGTRAVQLKSPVRYFSLFLDLYGRPVRYTLPDRDTSPSIAQALHVYAGDTYTTKLNTEGGRLDQLLQSGKENGSIIEELYLAALSRFPDENEQRNLEVALSKFEKAEHRQAVSDLTWALLNSREFAYNH